MVKPWDRLRECTGFEWDEANATKNWDAHEVSQAECEQIFFNRPLLLHRDRAHSQRETRYYVLGQTDSGRLLFAAFTIRGSNIRIISARDMTPGERKEYEK